MDLLNQIKEKAKQNVQTIVLPEGEERRTLIASNELLKEKIVKIILIGNREKITAFAKTNKLEYIKNAQIIDPPLFEKKEEYAKIMVELRRHKGMTKEKAYEQLLNPYYLGTMMIKAKDAYGMVAGAICSTANTIRPAFQYIKTLPGISIVSGAFIMVIKDKSYGENGLLIFADCAVHPDPTEKELAEIAVTTANTTRSIAGFEPRVAMLSFSTKDSAKHPMVDKVKNATKIAKKLAPNLKIDGELQADAAIIEAIGKSKAPNSDIAGSANVLIFPTLEVGNIAYKLVQRLADAEAIGPILQGLAAPINDLSRGCSVSDIVNLVAITAIQ